MQRLARSSPNPASAYSAVYPPVRFPIRHDNHVTISTDAHERPEFQSEPPKIAHEPRTAAHKPQFQKLTRLTIAHEPPQFAHEPATACHESHQFVCEPPSARGETTLNRSRTTSRTKVLPWKG